MNKYGRIKRRKQIGKEITKADIEKAKKDYFAKGGKITHLPPQAEVDFMRLNRFPLPKFLGSLVSS